MSEQKAASECRAEDYPVWADGSQDRMVCEEPAGHRGPHVGDGGDWSWTVDARGPFARADSEAQS